MKFHKLQRSRAACDPVVWSALYIRSYCMCASVLFSSTYVHIMLRSSYARTLIITDPSY